MEKTSGLVLDHYDDPTGEVMKGLYPTEADVPDFIKQAQYLSPEEREGLPSHVFALELVDGETTLRKYACVDAGNTALSVGYFLENRFKLPSEAQKIAATNLLTACGWYNIEPPGDLQKVAMGLMTGLNAAMLAPGTARKVKGNLAMAKGMGGSVTPEVAGMGHLLGAGAK